MTKSKAEKREMLLKKMKATLRTYYSTSEFKPPVMMLMKKSKEIEWYEKASEGQIEIEHTDGSKRRILLDSRFLHTFNFGKKPIPMYICHEDFPTPLPNNPEITSEMVGLAIDKTLNDIKKWKAEEYKARGKYIWSIVGGICALIGMYLLFKVLFPGTGGETEAVQAITNATIASKDIIPTIIQ